MTRLLSDVEVAAQLGISKGQLQQLRCKQRGYDQAGKPADLLPRWVDAPGDGIQKRVRGTSQAEVDAWVARNTVGGAA